MAETLSEKTVKAAVPRSSRYVIWDDTVVGFGLRVTPSGSKSWIFSYRAGGGRRASKKRFTIGDAKATKANAGDARKTAEALQSKVRLGQDPQQDKVAERGEKLLAELIELYLTDKVKMKNSARTFEQYEDCLNRLVRPALGSKKAKEITPQEITALHNQLEGRPYLANRMLSVVSSMYRWAATQNYVPQNQNPASGISRFKEEHRERLLSSDELVRLGDALQEAVTEGLPLVIDPPKRTKHVPKNRRNVINPHAVAAIRLLMFTGARLSEILNLKWDEVNFEHGLLLLPKSKTGKREIILNAPALGILADLPRVGAYVIASSSSGTRYEKPRRDLKKPWATISKRAGLEGVRVHDLRHHYATIGASSGMSLPIVGKLLGHTTPATTARYGHLQNDPVRRAADAIGDEIAKSLGQNRKPSAEIVLPTLTSLTGWLRLRSNSHLT